jgi:hypothetical protein
MQGFAVTAFEDCLVLMPLKHAGWQLYRPKLVSVPEGREERG